jgi:hypothetical protein
MGNRDSWFMASTLVAGCVFLGPEPVRAGSTQLPSDSMNPRQIEQMEKCDAIKQRYADLARQFSEQAKQIANDADRAERLVPAQYIPTRRWQADYDRALLLNDQSVEMSRLGDGAYQRCSETTLALQRQRQGTRGARSDANQPKRNQAVPVEAP